MQIIIWKVTKVILIEKLVIAYLIHQLYSSILQDRRASEKQKEIERVKEKQQKELSKQKQIEKVCSLNV